MPVNSRVRKLLLKFADQIAKGALLLNCPRVLWPHRCITAPSVGYPDTVGVVAFDVRPDLFNRSACLDRAVQAYKEVIPNILEPPRNVPLPDFANGHITAFGCSGAMDDDAGDGSHVAFFCKAEAEQMLNASTKQTSGAKLKRNPTHIAACRAKPPLSGLADLGTIAELQVLHGLKLSCENIGSPSSFKNG